MLSTLFQKLPPALRLTALFSLAAIFVYALLWITGVLFQPKLVTEPTVYPAEEVERTRALRAMEFNVEDLPVLVREVDYMEGPAAAWWPQEEAPVLESLVKEGHLPPLEERVGEEPLVLAGVDGIGNYGGTWIRVANSPSDVSVIEWRLSYASLVRWSPGGYPIVPHVAKSWEVNDDYTEWIFHLRRGMKWSDGHPFTAQDIEYWYYWEILGMEGEPPEAFRVKGTIARVEALDDLTVKFSFDHPQGLFLELLARATDTFSPEHYMKQFHPDGGDPEAIRRAMEAEGLTTERAVYVRKMRYDNPEHPRIWPWIYRTHREVPPQRYVRNPYYWVVDQTGKQLPYIDRVQFEIRNPRLIPNLISSGMVSMQTRHLRFDDYTLYMSERERQGYDIYHWYSASRTSWAIFPNLNRIVPPGNEEAAKKKAFLTNRDFRIALSLAINREAIIKAVTAGVGEPAQISPGRKSRFFNEKLHYAYTEFDPDQANALLDAIGLDKRDIEGYRTFPDGSRMTWFIDYTDFTEAGPVEFIVNDWARVGIRARQRERNRPLFFVEKYALMHDFTVWTGESEFLPLSEARSFVPLYGESHQFAGYGRWYRRGGFFGADLRHIPGAIEPPEGSPARRVMEYYVEATSTGNPEEQRFWFDKILEVNAEELFTINIATPPPQPVVVKKGLKNVPRMALFSAAFHTPGNAGVDTYFFEDPFETPAILEQTRQEILEPTVAGRVTAARESSNGPDLSRLIRWMLWGILIAGLLLVSRRHPYVGRRLLIMIPTLLIISLVVFMVLQAPPGSYIQSKELQAQVTQNPTQLDQVRQIREIFPVEQGFWYRYADWMGLPWFVTFQARDTGLLQGDLGTSMETLRDINDMVGDRILLTLAISLGTILLTWCIALPIGIFSAARQYTFWDYALTLIGFIGMCVPNFLLALLLMYWSDQFFGVNISGLFSEEYATQPGWSTGKVIDLLKHLWVPVVVLAVGGTATMIRIMRGNLLDELNKPYVVTARAKGVRPLKLLLKYPVRIALNPFISGIGSLFPQLLSGGAIVALVLSLPTVGPLMLDGLLTEDYYLAGSMLMVLSLLGVLGTLVSDLLLLWLDPRIRYEGGGR